MGMFTEEPMFEDPNLPAGWYRKVVQRQTGATAGQWDVYVYNPDGKKFRSRNELRAHLQQIGSSMCSDDFDFSVKGKGHHSSAAKDGESVQGTSRGGEQSLNHNNISSQRPKIAKSKAARTGNNNIASRAAKKPVVKRKRTVPPTSTPADAVVADPSMSSTSSTSSTATTPATTPHKGDESAAKKVKQVRAKTKSSALQISKYFTQSAAEKKTFPQHPRVQWNPPPSPYQLVQEQLYGDPWQLLVATIFLNKTNGKVATPLIWKFLERWPSAEVTRHVDWMEIAQLMMPLGLHEIRAKRIVQMSEDYLTKEWQDPVELYGISKYGRDSYEIFCRGRWKEARPTDIMLSLYLDWIWTNRQVLRLDDDE